MLTDIDFIIRLTVAAVFGAIVGIERERHNQPAGLRTHIILSVGSALAMCLSIQLSMQFKAFTSSGDPTRLAAQVISGIGFLGAGAIIRHGVSIKGLTTAASLWTVAIIGLAVGSGHFLAAGYSTLMLLFILTVMDSWEKRMVTHTSTRIITVVATDSLDIVPSVRKELEAVNAVVKSLTFNKNIATHQITIRALIKLPSTDVEEETVRRISAIEGCKDAGLE